MNLRQGNDGLQNWQEILGEILDDFLPPPACRPAGGKIIHDLLWGSQRYHPWEILLLDTPLCQRLRRISQLGMAGLTFPSCTHHRFSHMLGVTALAGRLARMLQEKAETDRNFPPLSSRDVYTIRLAGLLHDIGHCFFSHASEQVLQEAGDRIRREAGLAPGRIHELFAWLILRHPRFLSWWSEFALPLFPDRADAPDPAEIADLVLGIPVAPERAFLGAIISGPYDVDKLEYLYRDARMAGLEIAYDIDRFLQKLRPVSTERGILLAMDEGGVRAVEQLVFSRLSLFSFVYHHQKVLAGDALLEDMLDELLRGGRDGDFCIRHPLDFLRYTDNDLLALAARGPSPRFESIRRRLIHRQLPRRSLLLARDRLRQEGSEEAGDKRWREFLAQLAGRPLEARALREMIVARLQIAGVSCGIDDLHLLLPRPPSLDAQHEAPVHRADGRIVPMAERLDLHGWEDSYTRKKHCGYLFARAGLEGVAATAAADVLEERYGVRFSC